MNTYAKRAIRGSPIGDSQSSSNSTSSDGTGSTGNSVVSALHGTGANLFILSALIVLVVLTISACVFVRVRRRHRHRLFRGAADRGAVGDVEATAGEKPVMHDVFLDEHLTWREGGSTGGTEYDLKSLQPLAAAVVHHDAYSEPKRQPQQPAITHANKLKQLILHSQSARPSIETTTEVQLEPTVNDLYSAHPTDATIAVVIAMPRQQSPRRGVAPRRAMDDSDREHDIGEIVIGYTHAAGEKAP
ncbi:hypothetical protein FRB94_001810 [Tulasnella sp. JGI-2019a]|nr:hypothetical protein FRB94_001810 [Tulasnella sp. JGI-2019a]KAG9017282.1 hypothetical protein FRB93_007395 [Tulasnella sp. JGI-2019a]